MKQYFFKQPSKYNGRYGRGSCKGLDLFEHEDHAILSVINKAGVSDSCLIFLPKEELAAIATFFHPKRAEMQEIIQRAIDAFDLDDKFGEDIDARHAAEEDAVYFLHQLQKML